jgi:hypothetical protein
VHTKTGEENFIIKLRGITFNHENAKRLQYDNFKQMVLNFGTEQKPVVRKGI